MHQTPGGYTCVLILCITKHSQKLSNNTAGEGWCFTFQMQQHQGACTKQGSRDGHVVPGVVQAQVVPKGGQHYSAFKANEAAC